MDFHALPSVGPYMYVSCDASKSVIIDGKKRTFRFLLYGAYNAMGLIGSECNGICILDEDKKAVVCDEIGQVGSGWGGPSRAQLALFAALLRSTGTELREVVGRSRRARYQL